MASAPIRRIVTGHDAQGKAVIVEAGPLPTVVPIIQIPGTVFHEIWSTQGIPVLVDSSSDPTIGPLMLPPPEAGTRIRVVGIPPDSDDFLATGALRIKDAFTAVGDAAASTVKADSTHPLMHRTESVDYGVVLDGEVTMVLDDSEVLLRRGDVVIQRGTNHAWANRSREVCRMLFVLVDGIYEPQLSAKFGAHLAT